MDNLPTTWYYEYLTPELFQAYALRGIIYRGRTLYQAVEVLETGPFGRCLVLDGKTQSAEADEFVYHEALAHPVLTTHPAPERVFIAGGGEGATLREVLSHRCVHSAVMVDLDREVVDLCRRYLPNHHQGAFDDPRLQLYHEDAQTFLERHPGAFDVVILDVPDPLEGGPAYLLYTQEFFELVRSRLTDAGLMVVQAGTCGPTSYTEVFTAIYKTVASVFPITCGYRAYVPSFGAMWGFVISSLQHDPRILASDEIDRRLSERLQRSLRYYDGTTHQGLFALPKYLRQGLEEETRLITRANPVFAV